MSDLSKMPKQALRRISVGLLASLVFAAPFALGPARAAAGCAVERSLFWSTIQAPSFPSGGKAMTAFTIDPRQPGRMFATNGDVVLRSTDGGCNWKQVYEPETSALPLEAVEQRIEDVVVAETGGRVYLLIEESAGPVTRPRIVGSDDGGGSWQPSDTGLPPGNPAFLRVAPSDPGVLYLAIGEQDAIELLFGSDDGGATWTLRNNFARSTTAGVSDIKVDPQAAQDLWVGGSDGLYHSTDGGRSFQADPEFAGTPMGPVDVFHAGGPANLMAFNRAESGGAVSSDGGQNWLSIRSPGIPTSIVHGAAPEARLVSALGGVWVYIPNIFSWVSTDAPVPEIRGLVASRTGTPAFYGFTPSTIAIFKGPTGTDVEVPPETRVRPDVSLLDPGVPPAPQEAKLTPDRRVIRIDAGDSKTVPYNLLIPDSKTPLDVYFLVDTSSSQKRFIVGMADAIEGIVNGLGASGTDVRFGLAAYDNYPDGSHGPRLGPEGSGSQLYEVNDLYQRLVDLSPDTSAMENALRNIEADGGGHYNAQLEALYQAATGEGYDVEPAGPAGRDVPPNMDASYGRDALRIALLFSDESFVTQPLEDDATPPDLRSFEETIAALKAKDIHQIGVSLRQGDTAQATEPMRILARETDAFAPAGGVDCDGDGSSDISAGAPLVCEFNKSELSENTGLTKGIVNLVESIRTRASVSLAIAARDDIVAKVTPQRYEALVLQASERVTFDATFRCPRALAGERFPVKVTAAGVDGSPSATATVVCRSIARSEEPPLTFPLDRVLGLIPLIPVGPPPPITELASSTQAQAQSQAQAQAQASMAAQKEEQPQLAFVHAVHAMRQKAQEEYAMSSFSSPGEMPGHGLALAGASLVMSLAAGVALSRQRTRVRVNRSRR